MRVAAQAVKAEPCDVHVLGQPRYFQQLQNAHAPPDMVGTDPACLAGKVNLLKPLMSEAADHSFSVNVLVYSVNRSLLTVDSSRVARFDVQAFAERGKRRFDLIQARVVP